MNQEITVMPKVLEPETSKRKENGERMIDYQLHSALLVAISFLHRRKRNPSIPHPWFLETICKDGQVAVVSWGERLITAGMQVEL